jgi:hypothetical protein
MKRSLKVVALRRFEDSDVHVDGIHFLDCVFERCRMVTTRNADVLLEDCDIVACTPVGPWPEEVAAAMLADVSRTVNGHWPRSERKA